MHDEENRDYLRRETVKVAGRVLEQVWSPRVFKQSLLVAIPGAVLALGICIGLEMSGLLDVAQPVQVSEGLVLGVTVGLSVAGSLTLFFLSYRKARRQGTEGYRRALAQASVQPMLALVEDDCTKLRMSSDVDALRAQSTAMSHAVFGNPEAARSALAAVDWTNRAPVVQAMGVSGRSLIALLCDHDAATALTLARRARSLAEMKGYMPGARAAAVGHATFVAVSEACADSLTLKGLRQLEQSANDQHQPLLQALSYYALAVQLARSGEADAALRAQAKLLELAPHAPGLKLWE